MSEPKEIPLLKEIQGPDEMRQHLKDYCIKNDKKDQPAIKIISLHEKESSSMATPSTIPEVTVDTFDKKNKNQL